MTQVFTLEPNPHWVIIDNFSKLPNGAAIYTYRSLNPSQFKPAFQDAAGNIPYGQPIVGFGNGTMPPIYWEFDDTAPTETYYIEVWSAPIDQQGAFLWSFDGLSGGTSGGGGTVTTNNTLTNYIINGEFYRNIGNQAGTPSLPVAITLAPSTNAGIGGYANAIDDGPPSPDIIFAKKNTTDSDSINFTTVIPGTNNLGINPTPSIYVDYNCTSGGTAQTYKYIQIPIGQGLQNFSSSTVSIKIYAKLVSGTTSDVTLYFRQFFGNGSNGPSADVKTPISGGPIPLVAATWTQIILTSQVIPSIAGKTLGNCGNDALFFQIAFPLSSATRVQFILPSMYLGPVTSIYDFHTLDQVDSLVNSPRTGDIRTSINSFLLGWINMNDGTIGNASSNGTARANVDTFQLFDLIWRTFQANQSFAPMFTSAGASIAYGSDSVTDFTANRAISLTRNLGRVMAGALPTQVTQAFTTPVANTLTVASSASFITGAPVTVSASTVPVLVSGTIYYVRVLTTTTMSLYTTPTDAIANTNVITFGIGAGTGNVIISAHALGSFLGEERHTMTTAELVAHTHGALGGGQFITTGSGGSNYGAGGVSTDNPSTTASFGNSVPFNVMQPTVYMNVFIKI